MRIGAVVVAGLVAASAAQGGERLSYVGLVGRLTNLEALAALPPAGEKCQQWSSYDRASRYDEAAGKYVGWTANGDGGGVIRREGNRVVLAEMDGPGVIWRIWSARAGQGHVRIYLDGAEEPAVDMPFADYFNGKAAPFQGKGLCHILAQGWNCYVPIPFQTSCRITADAEVVRQEPGGPGEKPRRVVVQPGWGLYYHFTYTSYPKGSELPTFKLPLGEAETAALAKANAFLETQCGADPAGTRPGEKRDALSVSVGAGKSARVAELSGPRAITLLRAKMTLPEAPDDFAALRELVLRITWDGAPKPQVWTPLGDFFGSCPGYKEYRSLPLGMADGAMYSLWYMPFAERAVVEVFNEGETARKIDFEIVHAPLTTPIETLGRFHARWHRDAFLPPEPERQAIDWTMLTTKGRGRFVGVMLHVWNPRGGWWGEGDEKFYVDGEKFPSTFGTGSEDYFGYAWCCPDLFVNAYHNQPHNDGGNRGHVCVNRWHITDNVPFQTAFRADIEKYYPNRKPTLYAATAYWYQAPGGEDPYETVPVAERIDYCKPVPLPHVKGALEGEKLKVVERTGGSARPQDLQSFGDGWSGIEHLWWTGGKPGDRIAVAFPVEADGRYRVTAQLTKARDYGIVQLSLDGAKLGEPMDLYNPAVVPTGVVDLGVHQLAKGDHRLTLEITGANPEAIKAYMAGLDYIKLDPAP